MPILALQPWSQFTSANPAKEVQEGAAGQLVFRGGAPVPLILRAPSGAGVLELEQAAETDDRMHPCGAVLRTGADVQAPEGRRGHVLLLNDAPAGICLNGTARLRPGDMVVIGDELAAGRPEPEPHSGILCFAAGTQVNTPAGLRRVETLRPGEVVSTRDKGALPLIWTGRREVLFARGDNRYRPVVFQAGSLGGDRPARDLVVSPDHHMVLRGRDVAELTGNTAALLPAGALAELRGVRQMLGKRRITYVHLMLESHAVLEAEGAEAESFYPTPEALAALSDDHRSSVFGHVPALRIAPETAYGPTALPIVGWEDARAIAAARKAGQADDALRYAAE